jgi:hypothetical protein
MGRGAPEHHRTFNTWHEENGYVFTYDPYILQQYLDHNFTPQADEVSIDRMACEQCRLSDWGDESGGNVSGLFMLWRNPRMYHLEKCPARTLVVKLAPEAPAETCMVYGEGVPDANNDPELYLDYVLMHLDAFARSQTRFGHSARTRLEKQAEAWLQGLLNVENFALRCAAFCAYLNDPEEYLEIEAKKARAFARKQEAALRLSRIGQAGE